ncbi:MAG TPA: bifunctional precorrin-2 dehydrogenase/sirohydrochlorin ferrochelatase [Nitrososphaeraceae archaeon]|nr:bifunctional precorrin-2 dehydrogenase/sirohydrochlorin ferrochelatase [Nitrososphaeraceae archaeon]
MIIDLNLYNKKAVIVGGGIEGGRKVRGLLGQNCCITVISDHFDPYLSDLANKGQIQIIKSKVDDSTVLDGHNGSLFLLLACTDNRSLNRSLVEKGRSMGAFVYSVDDPSYSDFSYASIINIEGVMQVAISTSGKSPIMARQVRIKAERVLKRVIKKTDIENTRLQEFARNAARAKIHSVEDRKKFLYSLVNDKYIQNLIRENRIEDAKSSTIELLQKWGERTA